MADKTITALFSDEAEAHRAAGTARSLGLRDDQVALVSRASLSMGHLGMGANSSDTDSTLEGRIARGEAPTGVAPAGMLLIVRSTADIEERLVDAIGQHRPDRITREEAEFHAAGWTRFDEVAGGFGAVQISDDRLGTEPVPGVDRDRRTAEAEAAPMPGSEGGGHQARVERMHDSVLGTPDPALDRAPEPAPNTPAGERRAHGEATRAERNAERQNRTGPDAAGNRPPDTAR